MPAVTKQIERFRVKYLLITFQKNLNDFLLGENQGHRMPILSSGTWDNVYFTPSKIDLIEQVRQTRQGTSFEYSLSTFLPGEFIQLSKQLRSYSRFRHLILMVLEDGRHIMLGNEFTGAEFTYRNSQSDQGTSLNWSLIDSKSLLAVDWLPQFKVTAQGMLQQLYGDSNTYSLAGDGSFSVVGPDSPHLYINESKLLQV